MALYGGNRKAQVLIFAVATGLLTFLSLALLFPQNLPPVPHISYDTFRPDWLTLGSTEPTPISRPSRPTNPTNPTKPTKSTKPAKKPSGDECIDPYRSPGYLDLRRGDSYRETRWIPLSDDFLDAPDPPKTEYDPESTPTEEDTETLWWDRDKHPDQKWLNHSLTPKLWFSSVLEENSRRRTALKHGKKNESVETFAEIKDEGNLSWLWGRVVLIISDSIDRLMIEFFCQEMGSSEYTYDFHATATCFIPSFNLTFLHWHMAGMPTHRPVWWWDGLKVVPFEERFDTVFNKTAGQLPGINGKGPDLILWQSALWDRANFVNALKWHYNLTKATYHPDSANWESVRFYTARLKKFLSYVRKRFGDDTPLMLRSVTLNRDEPGPDTMLYDIDRMARAVGVRYGAEIFEWGRILAGGRNVLYRDKLHIAKNGGSWLWSNMILEYLARSAGVGIADGIPPERERYFSSWGACHQELIDWGGR